MRVAKYVRVAERELVAERVRVVEREPVAERARSGRTAGGAGGRISGAGALALVLALVLAGCGGGHGSAAPATVNGQGPLGAEASGCPEEISRLVDPDTQPTAETVLALDFSGSFISTGAARARMRAQVEALVGQSIESNQALRVLAFNRSASGASTVLACPSLAPSYNNAAARSRKVENLKRKARAAVGVALEATIRSRAAQPQGSGTSIVGGFLALAESPPLVRPGTPRDAVMFSDGEGLDEDATVDLAPFRTVSLYGVGANANGAMDTPAATATAARWLAWLTDHGAKAPKTSTQSMF